MNEYQRDICKDNRIIYIRGEITQHVVFDVVLALKELENDDPKADILMYIDSIGGFCDSFLAIHDAMKMCVCDVATICLGRALSCGQMLLMSGTKGKRFISQNSRIMLHAISDELSGYIHDIENSVVETRRMQSIFEKMIAKYTHMTIKQAKQMMLKDNYLSPTEALKLGLVDVIIKKPEDLYGRLFQPKKPDEQIYTILEG